MAESSPTSPKKCRQSVAEPPLMSTSSDPMTKTLLCSICLDVFNDPVSTPCGHNFCRTCLNTCWNKSEDCRCPYCKETFKQRPDLKINTTLRDVVDEHKKKSHEEESKVLCDICADEKLKAVKSCLVCQSSYCKSHLEPHLRVPGLQKHKLMDPVKNLQDYICQKHERPLELFCRDDQARVCLSCIDGAHKNHNTVPLEEESKEKVTASFFKFMINIVNVEQMKRSLTQMQGTLHEKLSEAVLKWMQQYAVDVTLDPDTACSELILSDDKKQVRYGNTWYDLPYNPKRFERYLIVLAKEGFSSGRFYFEVQVKGKTAWDLGVATESVERKGPTSLKPVNGFWAVILRGKEYIACIDPNTPLSLSVKPQKVGVFVDYVEGLVSFYEVESRSHIYTYTGLSFTGKLYPFLDPCSNGDENSEPLIITPVNYFQYKK